ncbi:MAG: hypothetical protein P8R54_19285, partial [Myxococcota bacterium]|nr:hypothetical protein [Myxococcota bacterium]
MSKLKVGDITITPDGIRFDNTSSSTTIHAQPPQAQPQVVPQSSVLGQVLQNRPWLIAPIFALGLTGLSLAVVISALALYFSLPWLLVL